MTERTDFRAALRAELVAAAARPVPSRPRAALRSLPSFRSRPSRPVLVRVGLLAAAAALVALVIAVDPWGGRHPAPPARHTVGPQLPGRDLFGGNLEAGVRYRTRSMVPQLSFVPAGSQWFVYDAMSSDVLQLQRRRGIAPNEQPPVLFVSFLRIPRVVDPATGTVQPAPRDLAGWLRSHPDVQVSQVRRTRAAGYPATEVDFTVVRHPSHPDPMCWERFRVRCTQLAPNYSELAGSGVRLLVLDSSPQLAIALEADDPAQIGDIARQASAIVASLRIGR